MSDLPTSTSTAQRVEHRVCSKCSTRWSGVEAPYDCPECEGPSMDSRAVDAAASTAPWAIDAIRYQERKRLAEMIERSANIVGTFTKDGPSAVRAVAYMMMLKD